MASSSQLPCDSEGACMLCKAKPAEEETLTCKTCATPWHVACLSSKPETMAETLQWECPDCSALPSELPPVAAGKLDAGDGSKDLVAKIRAIEADATLTEMEKARKRQQLMSGKALLEEDEEDEKETDQNKEKEVLDLISGALNCSICMQLPERPVTAACGHNFCLKCFQKWIGQGKNTCAKCRRPIPPKMASQPRINLALVDAIRKAKLSKNRTGREPWKVNHFLHNQDRPDKAYTTERAQRNGKANAASGRIFVTVPQDHFGPIPAENDPVENRGVLVGDSWDDRLECRQWGVHFPHVSGIAGQSNYGAQSVVLSGGYVDDEDHGEWFLYTGSGGRDLSGNKRVNKTQSFDQKFEKYNMSLQVSCLKGYPVRVVRSHKEKRSSYAPEKGLRYDGVYRIEKCWRKVGLQGFKVCRYLFVRCDNEPAPWTSDDHGDQPRPLPAIPELKKATDISERKESPSWDFDEKDSCWKWKKPPPRSQKPVKSMDSKELDTVRREIRKAQNMSIREKLLKEFSCLACKQVMASPVTTPCAHNFCKACLEGAFVGQTFVRDRSKGGRSLRCQKNVMKCPACPIDISDFLQNLQVNTELKDVIESLEAKAEENGKMADSSENANGLEEDYNEAEENGEMVGPSGNANGLEEDCNETSADEDAEKDEDVGLKIKLEQKHNGIPEEYDVSESKLEAANEKPDAAGKRNAKRKKAPAAEQLPRRGGSRKVKGGRKSGEDAEKDEDIGLEIGLVQKHNAISEESDVGESKLEAADQKPDPAVKRNAKGKKAPAGEQLPRSGGSRKAKRGRKSEEAVEGNDSPSSPLHLQPDDNE